MRARAVSRKQQGCIAPGPDAGFSAIATTVGGPCHGEFLRREPAPIRRRRWNCILQRPGFRGALARGSTLSQQPQVHLEICFFFFFVACWLAGLWLVFLLGVPLPRASRFGRDLIGTWGPLACHMKAEYEGQLPSADSAMLPPHSGDGTAKEWLARNTRPGADGRHCWRPTTCCDGLAWPGTWPFKASGR